MPQMTQPTLDKLEKLRPGAFDYRFKKLNRFIYETDAVQYCVTECCKDIGTPLVLCQGDLWNNNILWYLNSDGSISNRVAAFIDYHYVCEVNKSDPYSPGPSYMATSYITFDNDGLPVASPIRNSTWNTTFFIPNNSTESHGTEDPRINYINGFYHLFYTAYNGTNAMLSSAVTQHPFLGSTYQRQGYVFPKRKWSKSGATLFAGPENKLSQHYLFWGDSGNPAGGIGIATSQDSINWLDNATYLMNIRNDHFDSNLIESGPTPIRLKSGDFLFIYNSAQDGYSSVKPGWSLQYNLGYAILNENDPTRVVQRSDQPILSPELDWEVGNVYGKYLTPNVVFLEGLVVDPNGCPENVSELLGDEAFGPNAECFFGVYGGADSELGAVRIISSWVEKETTTPPPPPPSGKPIYKVVAQRFSNNSIINKNTSDWDYNYNAAIFSYLNVHSSQNQLGLLVRLQNQVNKSDPYAPGPSYIAPSYITFDNDGIPVASPIRNSTLNTTFFIPNNTTESHGTEDPRINYQDGFYYLFYTAYNGTNAMLSSAVTQHPFNGSSYQRQGYVFPKRKWSKSGATLFAGPDNNFSQHYLFWGDSSFPVGGIGIATSPDSFNWNDTQSYLMKIRNDSFDSNLVESGPTPLRLKTGDFLFVYNSARDGYPSVKPGWTLQYNLGFAILSGSDPTQVIQRTDQPILSPELEWEVGNTSDHRYLTPNVVFLEGLVPDPNGCPPNVSDIIGEEYADNAECFFGVYGGSDSELGAVRIVSSYTYQTPNPTETTTPSVMTSVTTKATESSSQSVTTPSVTTSATTKTTESSSQSVTTPVPTKASNSLKSDLILLLCLFYFVRLV
uniref:Uncharacterized protein n=1 Tax=Acrobeloides nanus TaxID=290746 RepID=A0A914DCG2_9BILA